MKPVMAAGAIVVAVVSCLAGAARWSHAQDASSVRIRTLRPGDILYMLIGGGGNALALMHDDGVVLIDTKLPGRGREIQEAIEAATDRPVTTIVNTHAHLDHVGGNPEFSGATTIVAHEKAAAAMARLPLFAGPQARFLPNRTVAAAAAGSPGLTLLDGADRIELHHFGAGHTDGDIVVVFPAKRVAYFGDLFPSKAAPLIDSANGGSGLALPETLATAIAGIKDITQVIPGHQEGLVVRRNQDAASVDISTPRTMRWADVEEYSEFVRDFVAAVRAAKAAGKNAVQAAASLDLPERYKDYDMRGAAASVEAIYAELSRP
jgi:glyoxylase-like metal-dependent hydrolase (beta-lactamase superfamily II)